jgi:hypothetical protein
MVRFSFADSAPGLRGEGLKKYAAAGITTDHESFTYEEGLEKIGLGIKCLIREGSAAKNFEALYPLIGQHPDMCMLCSDDKHPNDLVVGHINQLVVRAIRLGQQIFAVLRAACVNPVLHYKLDVGLLRPGDAADFIEVDNLEQFNVLRTVIDGQVAAERATAPLERISPPIVNQFRTPPRTAEEFVVPERVAGDAATRIRVIEAIDGQIVTGRLRVTPKIENGCVVSDVANDVLKMALVDRYNGGPPAVGFIKNFGLKSGAIASSVAHDSHNLLAVGVDQHQRVVVGVVGPLEEADRQDDGKLGGELAEAGEGRVLFDRVRQLEQLLPLVLAEIGRLEQLLQQDDLRPVGGGAAHHGLGLGDIGRGIAAAGELGGRYRDLRHAGSFVPRDYWLAAMAISPSSSRRCSTSRTTPMRPSPIIPNLIPATTTRRRPISRPS